MCQNGKGDYKWMTKCVYPMPGTGSGRSSHKQQSYCSQKICASHWRIKRNKQDIVTNGHVLLKSVTDVQRRESKDALSDSWNFLSGAEYMTLPDFSGEGKFQIFHSAKLMKMYSQYCRCVCLYKNKQSFNLSHADQGK